MCAILLQAQNQYTISFLTSKDSIVKSNTNEIIYKARLTANKIANESLKDYKVIVAVDRSKSTLPETDYKIDYGEIKFSDLKDNNTVYITINKDELVDRRRILYLSMTVKSKDNKEDSVGNIGQNKTMELLVDGIVEKDTIEGYSYLAYIGTNFDLVDGVKASNLFFATNIFLRPDNANNKVGVYLSLYGNRTMSTTDSTGSFSAITRFKRLSDTSVMIYREQMNTIISRVSDNLGAYICPLFKIWGASNLNSKSQLYYSPSLEFVWRRTRTVYNYINNKIIDSSIVKGMPFVLGDTNQKIQKANEYSFNVGLASLFWVHENKQISVRVYCSVGYSTNYYPAIERERTSETEFYNRHSDMFFSGRAWITEATTGITLQAEITNTLINSRPFYGVTLSKAINFRNLGTFFQPVVAR
jgi:hypothetical protein